MRAEWIMVLGAWAVIGLALSYVWKPAMWLMAPFAIVFAVGVLLFAFSPLLLVVDKLREVRP